PAPGTGRRPGVWPVAGADSRVPGGRASALCSCALRTDLPRHLPCSGDDGFAR
ncbi:unnamed protein product, partial [Rangifer tarandus platyrhynchus]